MQELRILVVDDHGVVREGVARILQASRLHLQVDQAASGEEALGLLREQAYDLIVTDLSMPGLNGLDWLRRLARGWPRLRILVLSMHAEAAFALRALRAGAHGYVAKDRAAQDLVDAIEEVSGGRTYVTRSVAEHAIRQLQGSGAAQEADLERLSAREFDVFRRIVEGQRVSDIAEDLHLSVKTVSTHKRRILDKLQLSSTAAMVRFGMQQGITPDDTPC